MLVNSQNLITKAEHNQITGNWAEQQGYFDVAVSRYYYVLYQKTLHILHKRPDFRQPDQGYNSHKIVVEELIKLLNPSLNSIEKGWIAQFSNLRIVRRKADYKNHLLTSNNFRSEFKYKYEKINEILDREIGG